jgi:hypothetical protein
MDGAYEMCESSSFAGEGGAQRRVRGLSAAAKREGLAVARVELADLRPKAGLTNVEKTSCSAPDHWTK